MFNRQSLASRSFTYLMSLLIALQPNMVQAQQAVITVDPATPSTSVDVTINGTPLLQIGAPNGSGISHNKFTDFNVGKVGLVINNATQNTTTQTGGAILKNPNFNGSAAKLILNEVTSANRSRLDGHTEIAGQKADYILANPNGITCNGCGFINTPRATLTTGTPVFDAAGALDKLSVNGGDVLIEGLGLNADETDAFDIITRSAKLVAQLNAKDLNIITGRNDVDYESRNATAKADDSSAKPSLAIDSSALGGMYAGRIALVATEAGVGVNMQGDMAATSGELNITTDGRLEFKNASAKTDVTLKANTTNALKANGTLYAGNTLKADAGSIELSGDVQAGGTLTLNATDITTGNLNTGGAATLTATNTASVNGHLQTASTLAISGTTVSSAQITAGDTVKLEGTTQVTSSAKIKSNKAIEIKGASVSTKALEAVDNLSVEGTTNAAIDGDIKAGGTFTLKGGALSTGSGQGSVGGTATIDGVSYSGTNALNATGNISVKTTGDTTINTGGALISSATVSVNAANITSDGTISSQTGTTLTATQALTTTTNSKTQSASNTTLNSTNDMTLGGTTTATNELIITAPSLTNNGTLSDGTSDGATLNITSNLTNTGLIYASGDMKLIVPLTLLNDEGQILAGGSIQIDKDGAGTKNTKVWNYSGNIESINGGITIATNELLNERKGLNTVTTLVSSTQSSTSVGDLSIGHPEGYPGYVCTVNWWSCSTTVSNSSTTVNKVENIYTGVSSKIISAQDLQVTASNIVNKGGYIASNQDINLSGSSLINEGQAIVEKTISSSSSTTYSGGEKAEGGGMNPLNVYNSPSHSSSSTTVTDPGDTFITAGGNITGSFADKIDNISIKKGVDPVTITAGSANVHATSATIGLPSREDLSAVVPLPSSPGSLYYVSKDTEAPSVLETNPTVATLDALYGSDYFVEKAGVNLAKQINQIQRQITQIPAQNITPPIQKEINKRFLHQVKAPEPVFGKVQAVTPTQIVKTQRLGDNYWEQTEVRNQIMATTHKRYLSAGITSDAEQFKTLMDNALAQHEDLELSYGIALSYEQIAKLTSDIVWMVEVPLSDGRKALKPVVYLAEATRMQIDSSGALVVAGGELNLTAANDITNSGTLSGANTTLTSTSGSLTNSYGKVKAKDGDLVLTADQDITNTGGLITGDNVTLTATKGDFTNKTQTWRQSQTVTDNYQGVYGQKKTIAFNDVTGANARITATNGNLNITSGQDINDSGATTLSASGDTSLKAGGDVNLLALETAQRTYGYVDDVGMAGTQTNKQTGTTLNAGSDLSIQSGGQTILQGTKGEAGGNISIASATDTVITATQTTTTVDNGNWGFGRRWSTDVKNDLAGLKAGGDVTVTSGLDTVINGANVTAGRDVTINSQKDTTIRGVQDSFKQDIVGKKYELHIDKRTTVKSNVTAGNNINIQSGEDLNIAGTTIAANKSVDLEAGQNIAIAGMQNVDLRSERRSKKGLVSSSSSASTNYKEKTVTSVISAGEDVNLRAANDVSLNATNVQAGQDISINADNNLTIAAAEDKAFSSETKTKSFGINLGLASYNSMEGSANSNASTTTVSSTLLGDNITLTAGTDLNVLGSQLAAANDANLSVGSNLNIENAYDSKETSSSSFKSSGVSVTLPVYYFDINLGYNKATTKADNVFDQTVVASSIKTGNDLDINVAKDASIIGSDLEAGGNLNLNVNGDLGLATAQNVHSESHSQSTQSGFSVGVSYNGFGVNVAQSKLKGTENSTLDVLNEGTLLKAGKDLNVTANNVTMISGELTSGNDTNLEAANDITLATAQDIHQTSSSTISGKTNSVGVSYGKKISDNVNLNVGANVSKGTFTTNTHTVTDTIQQGTDITAGNDINVTSGADTTLVNADLNAGGDTTIQAGGDVNLLAAADTHAVTDTTSTTKTSSVGATVGASFNYDNGGANSTFGSKDGQYTTGNLSVGVTQTKSKTTTTETTTTETTYKGTNLTSGGTTTVIAANNIDVENTETTGEVLSANDTVTAGGNVTETTVKDTVETVSTTTTTSSSSTKVTGPDLKQFALDTVGNAVAEMGANKIGDLKEKGDVSEGGGKILHALNGAVKGTISSGGNLDGAAAGAVGAVVGEIAADITGDIVSKDDEDRSEKIVYAATTAAMIAANLLGQDSSIAQGAASNAVVNNRLLHTAEIQAIEKTAEEMAAANKDNKDPKKRTKAYWLTELGNEALRQVDQEKARELGPSNGEALAILKAINHYEKGFTDKLGNQLKFLAQDNQYTNPSLFASTVMANKGFYDVVLKDYTPAGFENLKGVVSGSTLAISNALKEVTKSSSVVGGGDELYLSDEERINRTLELVETSKQIYQVRQELKQKRSDPEGKLSADQKSKLFLLNDRLELTKRNVVSGITQTMQKGFNQGAAKFVVENAEAIGLLLYDTMTPAQLLDGDAATRNKERIDGVVYLLKNWDTLPEQIADDFKFTMVKAKEKLDAGDHVGGMEIYGELTAKLGSSALSGLKLSADIASALGKIGGKVDPIKGEGTGNSLVDDFANSRTNNNPPNTNIDAEAGNPYGSKDLVFDAHEFQQRQAAIIAERKPKQLNDGSLIDNQGFVYKRNDNGSVTSTVANADQLKQSGIQLDYDKISTANPSQSAIARNANEQAAFDYVKANPKGGPLSDIKGINSQDARFIAGGFEKFHQSIPGPNNKNIAVHYQYNANTGQVVDMKIASPLKNAQ